MDNRFKTYHAGLLQSLAYRALRQFLVSELEIYNLTMFQWTLIGQVYDAGKAGINNKQLAALLYVDMSLVTNTVNALQKEGLLRRARDPHDGRARRIIATELCRKKVERIEEELRESLERWLEDIPPADQVTYLSTLSKLAEKIDKQDKKPTSG